MLELGGGQGLSLAIGRAMVVPRLDGRFICISAVLMRG
jgi:hypothetical protein